IYLTDVLRIRVARVRVLFTARSLPSSPPFYLFSFLFFLIIPPPPISTLFPYTTLFRSVSFFKVDKSSISSLREVWAVPGIYILLEPTGRYHVGRSDDLFVRIQKHLTANRVAKAILFKRSANEQFTHADTEWLEERLFATVSSLPSVSMSYALEIGTASSTEWE